MIGEHLFGYQLVASWRSGLLIDDFGRQASWRRQPTGRLKCGEQNEAKIAPPQVEGASLEAPSEILPQAHPEDPLETAAERENSGNYLHVTSETRK